MKRLTQQIAQNIIDDYLNGMSSTRLAKTHNTTRGHVLNIVKGTKWTQCSRPENILEIVSNRKQTRGAKIDQLIAQEIIDQFCQGKSSYELADKYNLWQTSICNLISGRTWGKCKRPNNIKEIIKERHEKGLMKKCHSDCIHEKYPNLTSLQKDIITGSLLGDGYLHKTYHNHPNSSFVKKQCLKYKEYLDWHVEVMSPFSKKLQNSYATTKMVCVDGIVEHTEASRYLGGYTFRTRSHPFFTEMRQQWYPNGKKIVPLDIKLTPLSIAIWFCDDGHNNSNNREAILCTHSFTNHEVEILSQLFQEFEITANIRYAKYHSGKKPFLKFNSTSYDNLIELIRPHVIWDCMSHKIKWRKAKKQWEYSSDLTEQDVLQIYELSQTHKQYEIAEQFNVHKNTISSILRGESWQHLFHNCSYIPKSVRRNSTNKTTVLRKIIC